MSFIGQIKSILNGNDSPPAQGGHSSFHPTDRRRKNRFSHKGRKILVVDDSVTVAATFGRIFRSAGCVMRGAIDAETGLEIARDERPDLIFLDIVLPGMNGFAALRQLRRDPLTNHIPVIVISGNEQATGQFYAKRIGADAFMKKPFSREDVFDRMETLVAGGKLAKLDATVAPKNREGKTDASPDTDPRPAHEAGAVTQNLPGMTALEARSKLASMGLQYFNQEQFAAAIDRNDKLAVELFVVGRGITI
jgi:twitching motility two-component system response regulator PilH